MKRLAAVLLILVACADPKAAESRQEKCADAPNLTWRYSHTVVWTTQEPVYEYHYDYYKGEWVYGQNGTETVEHSRDVYDCLPRR